MPVPRVAFAAPLPRSSASASASAARRAEDDGTLARSVRRRGHDSDVDVDVDGVWIDERPDDASYDADDNDDDAAEFAFAQRLAPSPVKSSSDDIRSK